MRTLLILICLSAGCTFQAESSTEQSATGTQQPVYYGDGRPGTADASTCGRHSAVGYVSLGDGYACTGVLVRNNVVLTAQHCNVVANVSTFRFVGTPNDDSFTVVKVSKAPGYQGSPGPNDISVLQLDRAVPRHVAQPLWLLIDPPETLGSSLEAYHNPYSNWPELCGYGGTRKYDSADGSGTRRYVPAVSLEWATDPCDSAPFEGFCAASPFWRYATDLESSSLNYHASVDSGGALIGYVKGLKYRDYYATNTKTDRAVPALIGIISGFYSWNWGFSSEEGEIAASTFNISSELREFLAANVYAISEAPYDAIDGPSIQQLAIYGTDWGVQIDDRAIVYDSANGYGDVASNPLGWLDCDTMPTTSTPDVLDMNYFSIVGPDSHVGNVWANDNLRFHDRATVHGTAYSEGDISVTTQAVVAASQSHKQVKLPRLNVSGMAIPEGTRCSNIALEPDTTLTVPTNCAYIPSITVKSRASATFPCQTQAFHVGNLATEPDSTLVFATGSQCSTATVYVHGSLSLKGAMSSGIDPASVSYTNVLFVMTSTGKADVQTGFNGVLLAPNALIHLVPGQKHYGAFYGKRVFLEQDSKLYFRPFVGTLPIQ